MARTNVVVRKGIGAAPSVSVPLGGLAATIGLGTLTRIASARRLPAGVFASALPGVINVPAAPVWSTVPTITFTRGVAQNISIAGYVTDPNNDPLVITKNAQALPWPQYITYSSAQKRFEYTGNSLATATFTDGHVLTADDGVVVNQPPVWQTFVNQSMTVGVAFSLNLDTLCADPESQPLTYTILSGSLPAGVTQSGTRGQTISGTPTSTAGSPLTVTFRATD